MMQYGQQMEIRGWAIACREERLCLVLRIPLLSVELGPGRADD